jgi:hypothetical protein
MNRSQLFQLVEDTLSVMFCSTSNLVLAIHAVTETRMTSCPTK